VNKDTSRRQYLREYYHRNDEDIKEGSRRFHHRNKENISDRKRAYYSRNKDAWQVNNHWHHIQNRTSSGVYSPRKPKKSWNIPELVRSYFESIKGQLLIVNYTDWYRISYAQIAKLGGVYFVYGLHCF
jgi:hypothetical protein